MEDARYHSILQELSKYNHIEGKFNKPSDFCKPTVQDISLIIKFLNPREATVPDFLLLKVIQFGSNIVDSHPYNNLIKERRKSKYSEETITASVRSILKKNKRNKIENYKPVSILNRISKVCEIFILFSLTSYSGIVLSNFTSPY